MSLDSWTLLPSVGFLPDFLAQPLMGMVLSSFFLHQKLHFVVQLKAATQPPLGMVLCAGCFPLEGKASLPLIPALPASQALFILCRPLQALKDTSVNSTSAIALKDSAWVCIPSSVLFRSVVISWCIEVGCPLV